MWVYTVIASLILSAHATYIEKECNGIKGYIIDNVFHEVETLKEDVDRPYLLAVDYSTNIVYFSYSIQDAEDSSKTARINLNTRQFVDIKGINNGFAQTVDQKSHEIYIGGSNGIYKYDYGKDQAKFYTAADVNIGNVFFKDVLYFTVFPSQFLYTHSNDNIERFKDLEDTKVDNFIVDENNVIYFTNATGLYSKVAGGNESVKYHTFIDYGVRGLASDRTGQVYACLQDGIYLIDKNTLSIEKVLEVDDAFGVAFDIDNNMVYSDSSRIMRLKPNKDISC